MAAGTLSNKFAIILSGNFFLLICFCFVVTVHHFLRSLSPHSCTHISFIFIYFLCVCVCLRQFPLQFSGTFAHFVDMKILFKRKKAVHMFPPQFGWIFFVSVFHVYFFFPHLLCSYKEETDGRRIHWINDLNVSKVPNGHVENDENARREKYFTLSRWECVCVPSTGWIRKLPFPVSKWKKIARRWKDSPFFAAFFYFIITSVFFHR